MFRTVNAPVQVRRSLALMEVDPMTWMMVKMKLEPMGRNEGDAEV